MGGQEPTPSPTHWCSLPIARPVTVTLNTMLVQPAFAWSLHGESGWQTFTCTAYPSVPVLCQPAGSWLGSRQHNCFKGSELGVHSTGACLSFCLIVFRYICVISLFLSLSLFLFFKSPWKSLAKTKMIYLFSLSSFSGKDTELMHKMLLTCTVLLSITRQL